MSVVGEGSSGGSEVAVCCSWVDGWGCGGGGGGAEGPRAGPRTGPWMGPRGGCCDVGDANEDVVSGGSGPV